MTGTVPVHLAAARGDVSAVYAMLMSRKVKEIDFNDGNNWTPLCQAVKAGHLGLVEFLICNGLRLKATTHVSDITLRST